MRYKKFGERVREQRVAEKLTQEKLAEKAGISFAFVGHIERGTRKCSVDTLVKLARALNTTPNYLLRDSLELDLLPRDQKISRKDQKVLGELYQILQDYNSEGGDDEDDEDDVD